MLNSEFENLEIRLMRIEKSLNRINNINWNNFGKLGDRSDSDLVYEYLRKLAKFYKENPTKPLAPFYVDVVRSLGFEFDRELTDISLSEFFEERIVENLLTSHMAEYTIKGYIKLSKFIDENPGYTEYLEIYDPLIRVLERGGKFQYKERGIIVQNSGFFPLSNWCNDFRNAKPIDISNI